MRDLCFIFDMDGTLVDSERLAIQALIELVPNIGVDQETLLHAYRGVKLNVMCPVKHATRQHLSALIDMRISMLMMELELDVQRDIFIH